MDKTFKYLCVLTWCFHLWFFVPKMFPYPQIIQRSYDTSQFLCGEMLKVCAFLHRLILIRDFGSYCDKGVPHLDKHFI